MPSPRLLILDDDELTCKTIQHIAELSGFEVRFTTSAGDFFAQLDAWPPDVVALDLIMPGTDGVDVIRAMDPHQLDLRLIITSGVGSRVLDAAERSARSHGLNIVGVLPKPFSAASLRHLLSQCLLSFTDNAQARFKVVQPPEESRPCEEDLRLALQRHEINLAYQPKIHCRTGTLVGFEALARWNHPAHGPIPPDIFIPLAEQHGFIDQLTCQIAEQALEWFAMLGSAETARLNHRQTFNQAILSLNLSASSLGNRELFDGIAGHCERLGIAPQRVVMELTESSAMGDATNALDNMTRLRLQGFNLSIDDFGTGYSSMVQLVKLPFSEIKVDKGFVMTAAGSEESRSIIRSVVDLGRSLGLQTTAEGVEDADTLSYLRELGCDYAQGYLISKPLAPDAVVPWFIAREAQREQQRLDTLAGLGLMDTESEPRFDRFTRLARRLFNVSVALISLVDHDRLWLKAGNMSGAKEIPRDIAFCDLTIDTDSVFVISDARADPRFQNNPLVTGGPQVCFYAGVPLCMPDGVKVGTLCLIDQQPRDFSDQDKARLAQLAGVVEKELSLNTDELLDEQTGLLSRDAFYQQASAAIALCRQLQLASTILTVKFLDLALVNQRHGSSAGNHLIRSLGDLVSRSAGHAELVGRRRGTEISVLLIEPRNKEVQELSHALFDAIVEWNKAQPPGHPRLFCEIASGAIDPFARGSLNQMLKSVLTPFATVIDEYDDTLYQPSA